MASAILPTSHAVFSAVRLQRTDSTSVFCEMGGWEDSPYTYACARGVFSHARVVYRQSSHTPKMIKKNKNKGSLGASLGSSAFGRMGGFHV